MTEKREPGRMMVWWPLAAALMAFVVAGARADTRLSDHDARLATVEASSREAAERLARVEQMVSDTRATTHRIEALLDRRP